jgi:RimJ/RimL family protein N-acetyltransferase
MTASPSTVLHSPRFALRPFRRRDIGPVHEAVIASLTELAEYLPWAHSHYSRNVTQQFIRESAGAWHDGRAFDFAIRTDADPGRHLGNVSVWFVSRVNMVGEIGYWVRTDESRRGVCTEAAARILRFGFEDLGLHRIVVRIGVGNKPSERVAEKLGFRFEGTLRDEVKVGSEWMDHTIWSLLEPEWRAEQRRYRTETWI